MVLQGRLCGRVGHRRTSSTERGHPDTWMASFSFNRSDERLDEVDRASHRRRGRSVQWPSKTTTRSATAATARGTTPGGHDRIATVIAVIAVAPALQGALVAGSGPTASAPASAVRSPEVTGRDGAVTALDPTGSDPTGHGREGSGPTASAPRDSGPTHRAGGTGGVRLAGTARSIVAGVVHGAPAARRGSRVKAVAAMPTPAEARRAALLGPSAGGPSAGIPAPTDRIGGSVRSGTSLPCPRRCSRRTSIGPLGSS
jgi:hypothetical protein